MMQIASLKSEPALQWLDMSINVNKSACIRIGLDTMKPVIIW